MTATERANLIRDISDMVDMADGDNPYRWDWSPCERCAGQVRMSPDSRFGDPLLVKCQDCGLVTEVVDAL